MSLTGAIRENTRRNESVDRGLVTFTGGSATVTVTGTPGPIRQVTAAMACVLATTSPGNGSVVTVGNIGSGGGNAANQFTIFAWVSQGAGGTPAAASAISVTASPFTYTATAAGEVIVQTNGATLTSLSFTRGAYGPTNLILPGAGVAAMYHVSKGDVLILTYSAGSPLMEFLPGASSGTLIASSSSVAAEWIAWGNLSAGQGF